ncbi:hypothetical protein D3C72_2438730 [compost metagenome]
MDWPGRTARSLCSTLYLALLDASEDYLHHVLEVADGSLMNAGRILRKRFGAGSHVGAGRDHAVL